MTLVVGRSQNGRVAVVADTLISAHDAALPMQQWALKSICLPGGICVSYSGSPALAAKAFRKFREEYPQGANYSETVTHFEASGAETNNDYLIAFANSGKLVTIRDGCRVQRLSNTHWIGDAKAYQRFRDYEYNRGRQYEQGRALNAVMFADEMSDSPASDLYSIMRNVVQDKLIPSVGGFVTVLSNRDIGFRFSVYSDVLFDWPDELDENHILQLTDKFDLKASGENDGYSVSQISPGYYDMNAVAFYVLKGRLLIVLYESTDGGSICVPIKGVEPDQIATTLDEKLNFPFHALCLAMSSRQAVRAIVHRDNPDHGIAMGLYCEVNTMPKIQELRPS